MFQVRAVKTKTNKRRRRNRVSKVELNEMKNERVLATSADRPPFVCHCLYRLQQRLSFVLRNKTFKSKTT